MAYDLKYGKITVEKEPGNPFGEDEPVFILRGRDKLAVGAIEAYRNEAMANDCPEEFWGALDGVMVSFHNFKNENPELMKLPD